jgi:hypothetical protein
MLVARAIFVWALCLFGKFCQLVKGRDALAAGRVKVTGQILLTMESNREQAIVVEQNRRVFLAAIAVPKHAKLLGAIKFLRVTGIGKHGLGQ